MKMLQNDRLIIHGFQRFEASADPRIEFQTLYFTMSKKTSNQLHNRMDTEYSRVLLAETGAMNRRTHMTYFGTEN